MAPTTLRREVNRVVRQLTRRYHPDAIILFGSLARRKGKSGSDMDLAVIKRTRKGFIDRLRDVALLHDAHVGVDILVYTPEEVARAQRLRYGFLFDEVLTKGQVLYRAA